jgi:hypothetical protein
LRVEQFYYGPKPNSGLQYEQTSGVSTLLPEDKIIELYNIGDQTRKPIEVVQLHQTYFGPPIISVTFAEPTVDDTGRNTMRNRTFLISLKEITNELLHTLRPLSNLPLEQKLEPLEIDKFTIKKR